MSILDDIAFPNDVVKYAPCYCPFSRYILSNYMI